MAQQKLPENGVVSYTATVKRNWLDYNEHMNVAYYVMAFDLAIDAFKEVIGISRDLVIHFTLVVNQAILGLAPLAAKIGAIERGLSKASGGVH